MSDADEWVEAGDLVGADEWTALPRGTRIRREWVLGDYDGSRRYFVHRDDLPDPDADLVERMARALLAFDLPSGRWEGWGEGVQERYRSAARAALAVVRDAGAGRVRWCNCADAPWDDARCREGECRESWRDAEEVGR